MSRDSKKPKKVYDTWCPEVKLDENPGWTESSHYERCPKCNKRLKVLFYDCHTYDTKVPITEIHRKGACIHPYLPKHKDKRN